MSDPRAVPSKTERLEGAWSPDVLVKLECLRHGQHSAISRLEMKCLLCHDANRPGVIERRYVDEAEVNALREELTLAAEQGRLVGQYADRYREAIASAMTSLATGPMKDGYAYAVLKEALSA